MYVVSGSRSSRGGRAGPTIYELNAGGEGRSLREVPRLVAAGLAITWRAGRRELIVMAAPEPLSRAGGAAGGGVGPRTPAAILAPPPTTSGGASVWPSAP